MVARNPQTTEERARERAIGSHTPSSLSLSVGDVVVYASHGIGRIESRHDAEGALPERIALLFDSGMRVTLPLDRARGALRCLSGEAELEEVRQTLCANVPAPIEPWSRRHRFAQEKLAEGRVRGLAEVVREGLQRERRLVASSRAGAPVEGEVCRKARKLLAAEIAASRGIEPEAADAWIRRQVGAGHT